jgi:hypothetical protein
VASIDNANLGQFMYLEFAQNKSRAYVYSVVNALINQNDQSDTMCLGRIGDAQFAYIKKHSTYLSFRNVLTNTTIDCYANDTGTPLGYDMQMLLLKYKDVT